MSKFKFFFVLFTLTIISNLQGHNKGSTDSSTLITKNPKHIHLKN